MNERIRELKEQAMGWVPNMADPDTKIRLLNAEKFAELIVLECLEVVEKQFGGGPGDSVEWDRAVDYTYNDVVKHFGVEE